MSVGSRIRQFYWRRIRRERAEICKACGRPVAVVWRAPTAIWNYAVAGVDQTVYTVREGAAGAGIKERAEGVGGTRCIPCFDRACIERGISPYWTMHAEDWPGGGV